MNAEISEKRGVYCFIFPNGKKYVGIVFGDDASFRRRMIQHKNVMNSGNRRVLYNALRKHGWDNVEKKVIVEAEDETYMKQLETNLIDCWKLNKNRWGDESNGYNLTDGGDGVSGLKHSQESRQKMSDSTKGRKLSKEHIEKIRLIHLGRICSPETRMKIGESNRKNNKSYYDPIWKEKQRIAHLGKKLSKESIAKREHTRLQNRMNGKLETIVNTHTGEIRIGLLSDMCREIGICYKNMKGRGHSKGWQFQKETNGSESANT